MSPSAGANDLPAVDDVPARAPTLVLWRVPDTGGTTRSLQFVDLQRDATVADIARAVDAGMRTVEHIKRYTTIGTAHDQGKTSGVIASGITAELLGRPIDELGTTTFRPPYTPVAFAALAGRNRGSLFDPERTTAVHAWHLGRGAVWEDVGQWKRPRYYPRPGEDMETAVLRECAAVRGGVGIMDGSTLGKIDVQGPDAAAFLDLLYTNMMSNLKVGSIRYGVMCRTDGMVLDDGTVLRLDRDRFLVYTTTGGAAGVLEWMEDWLQTEWPHLRVHVASVTEQWATFPVVGPRSRDVVAAVTGLDTSKEAFPFMTWQDTRIGSDRSGHDAPDTVCGCGWPGQLLRRARVRGQRRRLARPGRLGTADRGGGALRHHPVRHRDDARAPRGEGLPDHRAGHRRHGHPARPGDVVGGVEEEAGLPRQALVRPGSQQPSRPQAPGGPAAGGPHRRAGRGLADRRGSRPSPNPPCPCSATSPRATAAPSWTGASPSPW